MFWSLKELFENVDAPTIMDFIKEVNFYLVLMFSDFFFLHQILNLRFCLAFYIICFYHLLCAIAYNLNIMSFHNSQHPT